MQRLDHTDVMTIEGIRYLIDLKRQKKPLPPNWTHDVEKYIRMKEKTRDKWYEEYLVANADLIEIQRLYRRLLTWRG